MVGFLTADTMNCHVLEPGVCSRSSIKAFLSVRSEWSVYILAEFWFV